MRLMQTLRVALEPYINKRYLSATGPLAAGAGLLLVAVPLSEPSRASPEAARPARREPTAAEVRAIFRARLPARYRPQAPRLARALLASARRYRLSPSLVLGVIAAESGFDPAARSAAGAVGLMQLLPTTARETAARAGLRLTRLETPEQNIRLGVAYLAGLRDQFLYSRYYLAAYNLGPRGLRRRLAHERYGFGALEAYVEKIHAGARGWRPVAL